MSDNQEADMYSRQLEKVQGKLESLQVKNMIMEEALGLFTLPVYQDQSYFLRYYTKNELADIILEHEEIARKALEKIKK